MKIFVAVMDDDAVIHSDASRITIERTVEGDRTGLFTDLENAEAFLRESLPDRRSNLVASIEEKASELPDGPL